MPSESGTEHIIDAEYSRRDVLRNWFFTEWRRHNPDVFSETDWAYIKEYYGHRDVEARWNTLTMHDPVMLEVFERMAKHRFFYLLHYVYNSEPITGDLELIALFHRDPGNDEYGFKIRVGSDFRYFLRRQSLSEQQFADVIDDLLNTSKLYLSVRKCKKPVALLAV